MIVSTKGRYALRVMIDLAEHRSEKYVPLKEVAARQEISEKYLENILKVLVQNGFLEGLRGKGGGYRLTREPDQYTVGEILTLTEGSLAPVSCLAPCRWQGFSFVRIESGNDSAAGQRAGDSVHQGHHGAVVLTVGVLIIGVGVQLLLRGGDVQRLSHGLIEQSFLGVVFQTALEVGQHIVV